MSNQKFSRTKNRVIAGVCGGLAKLLEIDAVWVRIIFFVLSLVTGVIFGVIVYAILWAVMPEE